MGESLANTCLGLSTLAAQAIYNKLPTDNQSKLILIPLSYCSPAGHTCDMRCRDGGTMQGLRCNMSRYLSA